LQLHRTIAIAFARGGGLAHRWHGTPELASRYALACRYPPNRRKRRRISYSWTIAAA